MFCIPDVPFNFKQVECCLYGIQMKMKVSFSHIPSCALKHLTPGSSFTMNIQLHLQSKTHLRATIMHLPSYRASIVSWVLLDILKSQDASISNHGRKEGSKGGFFLPGEARWVTNKRLTFPIRVNKIHSDPYHSAPQERQWNITRAQSYCVNPNSPRCNFASFEPLADKGWVVGEEKPFSLTLVWSVKNDTFSKGKVTGYRAYTYSRTTGECARHPQRFGGCRVAMKT